MSGSRATGGGGGGGSCGAIELAPASSYLSWICTCASAGDGRGEGE